LNPSKSFGVHKKNWVMTSSLLSIKLVIVALFETKNRRKKRGNDMVVLSPFSLQVETKK
jgi:hypothetical protein